MDLILSFGVRVRINEHIAILLHAPKISIINLTFFVFVGTETCVAN